MSHRTPAGTPQMVAQALEHQQAGRMKEADALYRQIMAVDGNPAGPILFATMMPPIYQSVDEMKEWRKRLIDGINILLKAGHKLDITRQLAVPGFYENYQGMDDLELQKARARLYTIPKLPAPEPQEGSSRKIRVGFISKFLKPRHTVGKLNHGIITKLNRDEFAVIAFCADPDTPPAPEFEEPNVDKYITLPIDLPKARELIMAEKLDILFYTDLGMEPLTYTLAMSRLAPTQVVTWGHPVTTGLPNMDYFVSAAVAETTQSQERYSEILVKLNRLGVYYQRPQPPQPATPPDFDLPFGARFYGCPQSLYKFHPAFDEILAGILRKDPKGIIVCLEGLHPQWRVTLTERFGRTMPDVAHRVRWVQRQVLDGFLRLNTLFQVSLDPIHFCGGNTSFEALAMGIPLVTMPSKLLRGRLTYAMYKAMNMTDCVVRSPEAYIELAVRIGTDESYRNELQKKILDSNSVLFENEEAVRQVESFLKQASGTSK